MRDGGSVDRGHAVPGNKGQKGTELSSMGGQRLGAKGGRCLPVVVSDDEIRAGRVDGGVHIWPGVRDGLQGSRYRA